MYSSNGPKVRETITVDEFTELMKDLKMSFSNLNFTREKLNNLYYALVDFDAGLIRGAVKKIKDTVDMVSNNANLALLIKKHMSMFMDNRKPVGWVCSRCEKINPLSDPICNCERVGTLSDDQKRETVRLLRKMGCRDLAARLEAKLDDIPF